MARRESPDVAWLQDALSVVLGAAHTLRQRSTDLSQHQRDELLDMLERRVVEIRDELFGDRRPTFNPFTGGFGGLVQFGV